jgi:fructosamine-3-kinase
MSDHLNQLLAARNERLKEVIPLTGGSIAEAYKIITEKNCRYFYKTTKGHAEDFFTAEAANLNTLAASCCVATPQVIAVDQQGLLLDYLPPASTEKSGWQQLGEQLAKLHQQQQPQFGFTQDNYCGATAQPNPLHQDGFEFFCTQRLEFQTRMARDQGLLNREHSKHIDALCRRLPELIPAEPPCLLHGDLWSGNVHACQDGQIYLIDPACYWGWREADIAMTVLFGGFPPAFYDTYQQSYALQCGWQERLELYNLYHLLNHLNLFGACYLPQIERIICRWQ